MNYIEQFKWYLETSNKLKKIEERKENMGRYNIGDKFEIEISEIINDAVAHVGPYYKIKGFDSFVFDEKGLDRLNLIGSCVQDIDWSKVEVDTPVLVKDFPDEEWQRRYFARYEDGKVYAWDCGLTSWSLGDEQRTAAWNYAKLAEVDNG